MREWLKITGIVLFMMIGWLAVSTDQSDTDLPVVESAQSIPTGYYQQVEHSVCPSALFTYPSPMAEAAETSSGMQYYGALMRIMRTNQAQYISSLRHCLSLLSLYDGARISQSEKLHVTTLSSNLHLSADYYVYGLKKILI